MLQGQAGELDVTFHLPYTTFKTHSFQAVIHIFHRQDPEVGSHVEGVKEAHPQALIGHDLLPQALPAQLHKPPGLKDERPPHHI